MNKKIIAILLASTAILGGALFTENVSALEPVENPWEKPTLIYGGGLNAAEISQTKDIFEMDEAIDIVEEPVLGEDLVRYLNYDFGDTNSMISSVLVTESKGLFKSGINVDIATPQNITMITEQQYINAAITAGVNNVDIQVASIRPVTGESALTGVYKALDLNGEQLELDRMEVAQEELETAGDIADEAQLEEEDSRLLDAAMVEIKQELADIKERTGELATRDDIEAIINLALKTRKLDNIITEEHITRLIDLFEKYQETSAIDSEVVKEQLSGLANEIGTQLGDAWQKAEDSGFIERVVAAVTNFFSSIGDLLSNLFS